MNITLEINKTKKNFGLQTLTGSLYRNFLEIQKILTDLDEENKPFGLEHYDLITSFIVKAYGYKFSESELLDNLPAEQITTVFWGIAKNVNDRTEAAMKKLAKN